MRLRQVTVREGEWLGPVDWAYDFKQHDWRDGRGGINPECSAEATEYLRALCAIVDAGGTAEVLLSHDDRFVEVLRVGMWDGWPYWKPTPTVETAFWLGPEKHGWCSLRAVRAKKGAPDV